MTAFTRGAATNAAWNAFSTLSNIVIGFVIAPLLIYKMGAAQYGILLLIWSLTGILSLVGFGFGEATLRYVARYLGEGNEAGVNRVMSGTLTFYLVVCAVVCLGLFGAASMVVDTFEIAESDHGTVEWLLRLSAITFALRAVTLTYGSVPMALQRYDVSSKINIAQAAVRAVGYVVLALMDFGLLHIVVWDLVTQAATLAAQAVAVKTLAPAVRLIPRLSFAGLREIFGFSVYSFLTFGFLLMHRESGKLVLGAQLGPTPVAHLGTPDNVAHRLHMVVASGSETLMPRFSADRDPDGARSLFWHGTWASLAVSLVLFVPFIVLLPDFLRLWINPEFAALSAGLGQLVAFSYISQGAYAPVAAYFRGIGRPGLVTVVVAVAGLITLGLSVLLVPGHGAMGVGYAYVCGSVPAVFGVLHGAVHMYGRGAAKAAIRLLVLPGAMGAIAMGIQLLLHRSLGELSWIGLFGYGAAFALLTAALVFGADLAVGGDDAPSKSFLARIGESRKVGRLMTVLSLRKAR
jgi:O-antigen/teichoic acid export membrane protein